MPLDCLVGEWTKWSERDKDGKITRRRDVLRYNLNGGEKCPTLEQTQLGMHFNSLNTYHWINLWNNNIIVWKIRSTVILIADHSSPWSFFFYFWFGFRGHLNNSNTTTLVHRTVNSFEMIHYIFWHIRGNNIYFEYSEVDGTSAHYRLKILYGLEWLTVCFIFMTMTNVLRYKNQVHT